MDKYLLFYYACMGMGFLIGTVYLFAVRKKHEISVKDALLSAVLGLCASLFGAMLMAHLYNALISAVSGGTVYAASRFRLFGILLFSPFLIKGIYAVGKKEVDIQLDLYAAGTVFALGFAKIGCFGYGCCYGIACEHGVVNRLTGTVVVPVQLMEAAFCLVLGAVLMYLLHCGKCRGLLFPVAQIAYSVPRFFLEFLRYYEFDAEGNILGVLSAWQVFAVLTTLTGVAWLLIARKKRTFQ